MLHLWKLFLHNLKQDFKNLPASSPKPNPSQTVSQKDPIYLGLRKPGFDEALFNNALYL